MGVENNNQRKSYKPEKMIAFIREHLLDGMSVSDLCDGHGLDPAIYLRWEKEFFDAGEATLLRKSERLGRFLPLPCNGVSAEL